MTRTIRAGLAGTIALVAGTAVASDKVIASMPLGSVTVPTTVGTSVNASFSGLTEGVTGFGIVGGFTVQTGDFKDGLGPWSLDAEITANAPGGESLFWHPIGGDVTIADYPLQDGTTGLPEVEGNGTWTFDFTADVSQSNWIFRIDDATIYLLGDAPDTTTQYTAEPDQGDQWSRPFYIAGVSGLGPVAYHAYEFTVTESGVYDLTSVLAGGGNHFTFLYRGGFDPALPLENLFDYGLGNGNSPFGVPQGTSEISALLFEGEIYTWVTSEWSSSSPAGTSANTITGPGDAVETGSCIADVNGDGSLTPTDFTAWINAFNNNLPACDQNNDGSCTPTDFTAWINNFNAGC
ncbi:MAG: hypothetical protein Phyf2KO_24980 [Phycisphaerales bacterium]